MTAQIIRGDARHLPLADASVDLVVSSPPYFALRSYTDGGEHYAGQIGDEPTPAEFVDSLIEVTRECMRVLKQSGSLWINLGDSYASKPGPQGATGQRADRASANEPSKAKRGERPRRTRVEQFTRENAAWLAGVIDSDGSIGIHVNQQPEGRSPSFVPWVRIGQMRSEVVERAAELVGTGRVSQDARGVWSWAASAQQARWVLERVHPWLLIKKRQAWAAIEVARHVEERNAKGSWRPLTAVDVAYRQRLRDAVIAWNQGERDDLPVPEPPAVSLPIYPLAPREKSLYDIPHAYAQACVGRLGLIKRAEICWSKPNGLPESVTDRVRRSHEFWFHFTLQPRYYSAVDEIREAYQPATLSRNRYAVGSHTPDGYTDTSRGVLRDARPAGHEGNPLGKLPGSVWEIATEPLKVPDHLGIDHFAAFPTEWPRRIIQGWSPPGICTACGEGRRPVTDVERTILRPRALEGYHSGRGTGQPPQAGYRGDVSRAITGYTCACPEPTAPTRPSVVLDPFGGTGTTALAAKALGRHGITVDMSADYSRLARWRTTDERQLAGAMRVTKPAVQVDGQVSMFDLLEEDGGAA